MSKKIKDGWYIAAAGGMDDVSCVAFYWDAQIRKHIADAMTMLEGFNRVEGRSCTISVGLERPEIVVVDYDTEGADEDETTQVFGNPAFVFEPYVETISKEDAEEVCNAVQC